MSPLEKYETVKAAFVRTLEKSNNLSAVKDVFRDDVSRRRLELAETPANLLAILEAECLIGQENINGFRRISDALADPGLECVTQNLEQHINQASGSSTPGVNQYEQERRSQSLLGEEEVESKDKKTRPLAVSGKKREKIFRLVGGEIGKKWMGFCRGLGIRQAQLDNIEQQYSDIPTRIHAILERVERDKPEEVFNLICKALEECRRNDMQQRVRKILLEQ